MVHTAKVTTFESHEAGNEYITWDVTYSTGGTPDKPHIRIHEVTCLWCGRPDYRQPPLSFLATVYIQQFFRDYATKPAFKAVVDRKCLEHTPVTA